MTTTGRAPTFVLVPGGFHGAWCWELVVDELARRGCGAIAVDVPVDDPGAGHAAYTDAVVAQSRGVSGDIVVVGHSLAGAYLPLAAARLHAVRMVFIGSMIPVEGMSLDDQNRADPTIVGALGDGIGLDEQRRATVTAEHARHYYFHDCPEEATEWAVAKLRPQGRGPMRERFPHGGWPAIAASYIVCREDRCISPEWARRAALERLGTAAVELPGGHSPFLARPGELADALVALATE